MYTPKTSATLTPPNSTSPPETSTSSSTEPWLYDAEGAPLYEYDNVMGADPNVVWWIEGTRENPVLVRSSDPGDRIMIEPQDRIRRDDMIAVHPPTLEFVGRFGDVGSIYAETFAMAPRPFGAGLSRYDTMGAAQIHAYRSSERARGPAWVEYQLRDEHGKVTYRSRIVESS
jgi:hypothetical protein